jgi:DNA-binding response OmpR family regulator
MDSSHERATTTPRHRRFGSPRALVVEDDDEMRLLVVDALERDGFDVFSAPSARAAKRLLEELSIREWTPRGVDVVVTDVRMPGESGLDLAHSLRQAGWPVALVVMTAFADSDVVDQTARLGAELLPKPFRTTLLRRLVFHALSAQRRPPMV